MRIAIPAGLFFFVIFCFPLFAQDLHEFEPLTLSLVSGETVKVQLHGDGKPYGNNSIKITGNNLFIDLVIDDEFLQTSILDCSNTEDMQSPDRLSIMATSVLEMMFVPYMGPMPPERVDYSLLPNDFKGLWQTTLDVFNSLNNEPEFKNYIMKYAPDIQDRVAHAVDGIVAGHFLPEDKTYTSDDFEKNNVPLDIKISYGVGRSSVPDINNMYKMYRSVDVSQSGHSFSLNSKDPAWTQDQAIMIGVRDLAFIGVREIDIDPKTKQLKVVVDGEMLPELSGLFAQYRKIYCSKLQSMPGMSQIPGISEPDGQNTSPDVSQEAIDRLNKEIDNKTAELSKTITVDRWADGFDYLKKALTYLQTQSPNLNKEWLKKKDLDIEVQVPIVLDALNSYTPEIVIDSKSTRDVMSRLEKEMANLKQ